LIEKSGPFRGPPKRYKQLPHFRFFHVLRHLEVVLQGRQRFAGPVLQLRIFATLRTTLEERHVRTDLHRIIFPGEVFRLGITQLVELFLGRVIKRILRFILIPPYAASASAPRTLERTSSTSTSADM